MAVMNNDVAVLKRTAKSFLRDAPEIAQAVCKMPLPEVVAKVETAQRGAYHRVTLREAVKHRFVRLTRKQDAGIFPTESSAAFQHTTFEVMLMQYLLTIVVAILGATTAAGVALYLFTSTSISLILALAVFAGIYVGVMVMEYALIIMDGNALRRKELALIEPYLEDATVLAFVEAYRAAATKGERRGVEETWSTFTELLKEGLLAKKLAIIEERRQKEEAEAQVKTPHHLLEKLADAEPFVLTTGPHGREAEDIQDA